MASSHAITKGKELFTKVQAHLLAQNKKSTSCIDGEDVCCYRGADGLKCAIGAVIPDDRYAPELEGSLHAMKLRAMLLELFQIDPNNSEDSNYFLTLAAKLQGIHDFNSTTRWKALLTELGEKCGFINDIS